MRARLGVTNFKGFKDQIIIDFFNSSGYTFISECADCELREVHNIEKIYKSGAFDEVHTSNSAMILLIILKLLICLRMR